MSENKRRCEASEESLFTGSLDDSVLVGFGGIAVALAVGETLHHLRQWITLCACVVRVFGESKNMRRKKL